MESFFRRRRRLLVGVAAGAAGAIAAYYWYTGYAKNKLEQQRSVEAELTAILRGELQGGAAANADADGEDGDGDECGSPDLDESLDSHFNYIQKVSAPQELTNLLPRVQETLFRLTDVTLVKQLQQQQQAAAGGAASTSGGGGPTSAQQQLRLLARLCFGRTVAAVFLLPLMDLCVRTKLNVIGRHLFLQEKFSKLRQPAAPAARMRLPPRLTAAAVESFLSCEQLAGAGTAWLVEQAMAAAEVVLDGVALDAQVTPEELAALVQDMASRMGQAVTAAAATSATGSAWVEVLVGPSGGAAPSPPAVDAAAAAGTAEAYRRALASAAMVEELTSELRRVLCNYRFGEALHAAVGQCLSTCAAHIHATFISQAAAAAGVTQPARPQPPTPAATPAAAAQEVPAPQPAPAAPTQEAAAAAELPKQAVVSPFSAAAGSTEPAAQAASPSSGAAMATAAVEGASGGAAPFGSSLESKPASSSSPPEGEAEAPPEASSVSTAFASAVSIAANSASNSCASLSQPQPGSNQRSQAQPEQALSQSLGPAEPAAATPPPPTGYASATAAAAAERSTSGSGSCASAGSSSSSTSTGGAAAGVGGSCGPMGRKASLAAAAVAAMQPRPLARCLRAVQGACEPLFVDAREVTARIAGLPPVMSLCAVAFAAPLEL